MALRPGEHRVRVAAEIVRATPGVTIRVTRSRTVQHDVTIDTHQALAGEAGLQQLLKATIRAEIERTLRRTYQETETTAYEVALDGSKAEQYQLTWFDVMLTGTSSVTRGAAVESLPFEFRDRSELEIVPLVTGAAAV